MYLTVACEYDDKYNSVKARDINYLSAPFFHGCIEKAKSPTRGSGDITIASPQYVGIANVIDSLIIEPFHPQGESKYSALGRKYANIKTPDTETVRRWKETVER